MNCTCFKLLPADRTKWASLFKTVNTSISQLKFVKKFGEKFSITKPTAFILEKEEKHYIIGWTTTKNLFFDTRIFDPTYHPYEDNQINITLLQCHHYIKERLKLLDELDLFHMNRNINHFELCRKSLLAVFQACDLDIEILYERELELLHTMQELSSQFDWIEKIYLKLKNNRDIFKVLYDLYHTDRKVNIDFLKLYEKEVRNMTYKWSND